MSTAPSLSPLSFLQQAEADAGHIVLTIANSEHELGTVSYPAGSPWSEILKSMEDWDNSGFAVYARNWQSEQLIDRFYGAV